MLQRHGPVGTMFFAESWQGHTVGGGSNGYDLVVQAQGDTNPTGTCGEVPAILREPGIIECIVGYPISNKDLTPLNDGRMSMTRLDLRRLCTRNLR